MKQIFLPGLLLASLLVSACAEEDKAVSMPGSDEDAHGCKASAGYQWCDATEQCERPWELAEAEGFENTAEAFEEFCSAKD